MDIRYKVAPTELLIGIVHFYTGVSARTAPVTPAYNHYNPNGLRLPYPKYITKLLIVSSVMSPVKWTKMAFCFIRQIMVFG